MASNLLVRASDTGGYKGLGSNAGSTSAMAIQDLPSGAWAQLLDAGIHAVQVAHCVYNFAVDGGATGVIVPKLTALIPAGAVLVLSVVNAPTALAGTGNISVGTAAGSSATAILGATAISTYTTDYVNVGAVLPTSGNVIKMSAEGKIEITLSGTLTGGVFEVFVFFVMPANI